MAIQKPNGICVPISCTLSAVIRETIPFGTRAQTAARVVALREIGVRATVESPPLALDESGTLHAPKAVVGDAGRLCVLGTEECRQFGVLEPLGVACWLWVNSPDSSNSHIHG